MTMDVKSVPTLREIADRSWMEQASCRGVDTESWFLAKPPRNVLRHIERVCSSCPVTRLCLSHALVNNDASGAWGGYLVSELQPLRQRFAVGETLSSLLEVGKTEAASRLGSDAA